MKNVVRAICRKEAKIMQHQFLEQALRKQREARKNSWAQDYRVNIEPDINRIRMLGGA